MAKDSKYYWIKLKTDFFADDSPFDALMGMENGAQYICLYLKLCMMTSNNHGMMASQFGEVIIPFQIEKIKRDAKYFSIDTIRVGLDLFAKMGLIYEQDDCILRIANFDEIVGSEWTSAKRMRDKRKRDKEKLLSVTSVSQSDIDIRYKSIDIRDKSEELEGTHTNIYISIPTLYEVDEFALQEHLDFNTEKFYSYYQSVGWNVNGQPVQDWKSLARLWAYGDEERK